MLRFYLEKTFKLQKQMYENVANDWNWACATEMVKMIFWLKCPLYEPI